ncbi:MAG: hypothetical protein ACLP7A_12585 [Desulfobaccales bacterium]
MDDSDRVIDSLKVQIKKEIVDNYFAERVNLEEDLDLLRQETESYRKEFELLGRRFMALFQAVGSETGCGQLLEVLNLKGWPFYESYLALPERERQELLKDQRRRGFTASRRFRNLILDLYEQLYRDCESLREKYEKIRNRLKLINEDIDKFNLSYDFGLLAAQIEAMEGRGEVISGGLLSPEREELSTRMRFKPRQLTETELPPPPRLPAPAEIKDRLLEMISRIER